MRNIGVWMDKEKAHIVVLTEEREKMHTLFSEMEFFHPKGGSGTRFKGGPQDVVQDRKYLEREKHQFRNYFRKIVNVIKDADQIVLFGPADAAERFRKELDERYEHIGAKVQQVAKVDSMTENQIKALVRDFFN